MSEWTRPAQPVRCVVELDKPLTVHRERGVLAQGDANANAIVAEVYSTAGKPYDLSGCTVQLIFVRPDNNALPAINAEISGNTATATLPDSAYTMSGMYSLRMQLRKNGAERTIVWIIGEVKGTDVDGIADPEHVISIGDIMASAKEAQTAASNANAAAQRANAGAERAEHLQIDASGLAGDSNKLGGKPPSYYVPVQNLLINPDFAIAQEGYNGLHGSTRYLADMWPTLYGDVSAVKNADGITVTSGDDYRYFHQEKPVSGLTADSYTFAVKYKNESSGNRGYLRIDGSTDTTTKQIKESWTKVDLADGWSLALLHFTKADISNYTKIRFGITNMNDGSIDYKEPVLYPGTYTSDTLPPYVPPDPTLELAKCQEYYLELPTDYSVFGYTGTNTSFAYVYIQLPQKMREKPTVILSDSVVLEYNGVQRTSGVISSTSVRGNQIELQLSLIESAPARTACVGWVQGKLVFDADIK